MTVVLSSHLLSEVEQLCDRIAVLNQGKMIFNGQWAELAGEGGRFRLEVDDWGEGGKYRGGAAGVQAGHGPGAFRFRDERCLDAGGGAGAGRGKGAGAGADQAKPGGNLPGNGGRSMMLFFLQLWNELRKMFSRKRTYIGFGAFFVVECGILFLLNLPKPKMSFQRLIERNGYGFNEYYSGLTLGLMMVIWTTTLLGSLYLALVAGDLMAKEVEEGTMRMLLCRPVSRFRVALLKYLSAVIYTFALVGFIGISALLVGIAYRGYGGLFVFAPMEGIFALFERGVGLRLFLEAIPLLALSMASISSLGFLFSCCNMKPAAASIVTLSIIFLDFIFHGIPYFESLKVYFITTHLSAWMQLFQSYPPWWRMGEDYTYLLGLDATCFILGAAIFQRRDLK